MRRGSWKTARLAVARRQRQRQQVAPRDACCDTERRRSGALCIEDTSHRRRGGGGGPRTLLEEADLNSIRLARLQAVKSTERYATLRARITSGAACDRARVLVLCSLTHDEISRNTRVEAPLLM